MHKHPTRMKKSPHRLACLVLAAFTASAVLANDAGTQGNTPMTAQSEQAQRAEGVWIDVRTGREFQSGHLAGALNIPYEQLPGEIARISPDKNAPVHLYCRSGRRAEIARQQLLEMGYTQVINHGSYRDLAGKAIR